MPKKTKSTTARRNPVAPAFLKELLQARSPSGYEDEAREVVRKRMARVADSFEVDALGSCHATLGTKGSPTLMLAGHIDELGLIIKHVSDKGFLYFDAIGGHDRAMISGRRVDIMTRKGIIRGVTGKRAIHLMTPEDRRKVPEMHQMWIDIGAKDKKEALSRVTIGDAAVYDHGFEKLHGPLAVSRHDDKTGAYTVNEALLRLAGAASCCKVVAVSTSQEEIGTRGRLLQPIWQTRTALAVDVSHATDHPDADFPYGAFTLGEAHPYPRSECSSCSIRPPDGLLVEGTPVQIERSASYGHRCRAIQIARDGVHGWSESP